MPQVACLEDLNKIKEKAQEHLLEREQRGTRIIVGMGTCGIASGAREVMQALTTELEANGVKADIESVGCVGMCAQEPLIDVESDGMRYTYGRIQADMVPKLVAEHLVKGQPVTEWVINSVERAKCDGEHPYFVDMPYYRKQVRIALRNCGVIDPEQIDEYIARGGYQALATVVNGWKPADVIASVKKAGLGGRGGAGFLAGLKWELTARAPGDQKYVVCNADEGDPGAFMDRSLLEGDPHSVLEGMAIAGFAIGASEGYIYCRAEYPLAIRRLKLAIEQAESYGLLGKDIMGSGFSFKLRIKEGAGAFVCGEETALIASIEGRRGEPRPRPPFPAVSGLWGKPTNINNVETWANVPTVINKGSDWFAAIGTERSKGTKVFALTGAVNNVGLVEVPMGITVRDIVYEIGGGIRNGKEFKAVQTGGPLGGCLPATSLDTPVDYDSLTSAGATMGSGGMIVVDEDTCMVEFSRYFLTFATDESCGQCTPCRIGGKRMLEILTRITQGQGTMEDLDTIEELARVMNNSSLCALGQLTPNPVLSTLRHFKDEYIAHIVEKRCPAHQCKALVRYEINAEKCRGCKLCAKNCPVSCISGEARQPHVIDQSKCIRCGTCQTVCRFGAVDCI